MNQVSFLADLDQRRSADQQPTVSELDNADQFSTSLHTKGENASVLIYACSYCDFAQLDRDQYEIVAVTGNSMGWYSTLAMAGSLDWEGAYKVINTMGSMMKGGTVGGQVIYPMTDENWLTDFARVEMVENLLREARGMEGIELYPSIFLGGYLVFGGNKSGLEFLLKSLPQVEHFPFQLINHAAFHTPLLRETSRSALQGISQKLFKKPQIPMIDGRGHVWKPYSTDLSDLYQYTLGHQVLAPYDFTAAITVALKEFNPDQLILLGPGNTLGGAIGQILVRNQWQGITDKASFSTRQQQSPILLSLGR